MSSPRNYIQTCLQAIKPVSSHASSQSHGQAFAPSNIALIKYWGKREKTFNLPLTDSLSISLGKLGTTTHIRAYQGPEDKVILNHTHVASGTEFYQRISRFLDLFRATKQDCYEVDTYSNIPIKAGLASSASGFAALTLALNDFHKWQLPLSTLSTFARLGSGSAARSLFSGFVKWHRGEQSDGADSYAEPLKTNWPELCIGLVILSDETKPIGSTEAMNRTRETSYLYKQWPLQVKENLQSMEHALNTKDFTLLGQTAEQNALSMHATMLSSWPPICYSTPESLKIMHQIWQLRTEGIPVYFTQDAGPNIKLLFEKNYQQAIEQAFAQKVKIIAPFEVT